jgi:PAS domain-containing protein
MIDAIREQGLVSNYQLKAKRADGTPLWLLSSVRPITFGGKPAILGASIDISERMRAEEALRASEERFKAIADHTPDHILIQDRSGFLVARGCRQIDRHQAAGAGDW